MACDAPHRWGRRGRRPSAARVTHAGRAAGSTPSSRPGATCRRASSASPSARRNRSARRGRWSARAAVPAPDRRRRAGSPDPRRVRASSTTRRRSSTSTSARTPGALPAIRFRCRTRRRRRCCPCGRCSRPAGSAGRCSQRPRPRAGATWLGLNAAAGSAVDSTNNAAETSKRQVRLTIAMLLSSGGPQEQRETRRPYRRIRLIVKHAGATARSHASTAPIAARASRSTRQHGRLLKS